MNERLIIGPRDIYCKDSNNKSYSLALNDVTKGQVNIGSTVFINMKKADGTEATDNANSISMYVGGNMAVSITSTGNAAPNEHTHSYGSTTALTTTANNGSAVAAVTEVKPD